MPDKDISEMSLEEIRAFTDTLSKEEFIFALCIAKAYEELEQKHQLLKEQLQQRNDVIIKVRNKLGRYVNEIVSNGTAYAICVDLLDILNRFLEKEDIDYGK